MAEITICGNTVSDQMFKVFASTDGTCYRIDLALLDLSITSLKPDFFAHYDWVAGVGNIPTNSKISRLTVSRVVNTRQGGQLKVSFSASTREKCIAIQVCKVDGSNSRKVALEHIVAPLLNPFYSFCRQLDAK